MHLLIYLDNLFCICQYVLFTVRGLRDVLIHHCGHCGHHLPTQVAFSFAAYIYLELSFYIESEGKETERIGTEHITLQRNWSVSRLSTGSHCAMAPVLHHHSYIQHYSILYVWLLSKLLKARGPPQKGKAAMAGTNSTVGRNFVQTLTSVGTICFDCLVRKENQNKAQTGTLSSGNKCACARVCACVCKLLCEFCWQTLAQLQPHIIIIIIIILSISQVSKFLPCSSSSFLSSLFISFVAVVYLFWQ